MVPQNETSTVWRAFPLAVENSFAFLKKIGHNAVHETGNSFMVGEMKTNLKQIEKLKAGGGTTSLVGCPPVSPSKTVPTSVSPSSPFQSSRKRWAQC